MGINECDDNYRRYYQIGGFTIQLDSDIPLSRFNFIPRFESFRVDRPGEDNIVVKHHFYLPERSYIESAEKFLDLDSLVIYKNEDSWIHVNYFKGRENGVVKIEFITKVVIFSHDYKKAEIFHKDDSFLYEEPLVSLTTLSSDQFLLAPLLAYREGFYIHSSGLSLNGKGLVFLGHSGAGKSTIARMLKDEAKILCEDRIIVRRFPDGFKIYGTWDHGGVLSESPDFAPLSVIFFLKKANENKLVPVDDKREILSNFLAYLVRPVATADWWDRTLKIIDRLSKEVPFYFVHFDLSGRVIDLIKEL